MSFEGLQLGRYQLLQKVGSGGMGEVYLAEDSRIRRQVAIKVMHSDPTNLYPDTESARIAAQLFEREMKIISQLDHPHILPLYDYGDAEIDGTKIHYMVMPYRPEGSLLTWLRQRKSMAPLDPQDVATFIEHAASSLHHAHERQVIHQDIKPSNFLIRVRPEEPDQPDLLLTDFGISRSTEATSNTSQTIQGTPTYMAPEQWEGHPTYASDQYGLAVMAYELLVGRPPFEGKPGPVMYQHMTKPPAPPSSRNHALSTAIDAVVLRALAKKPEERYASVFDFANALQQAIREEGTAPIASDRGDMMEVSDPDSSPTPATPTMLPGLVKLPQVAQPPPIHTAAAPAPKGLLSMNQGVNQGGIGYPMVPPAATPEAGPGAFNTPMPPVPEAAPRPFALRFASPTVRILLIVLILAVGAGGALLYYAVGTTAKSEKNSITSSQHSGTNPIRGSNKATSTSQGKVEVTATNEATIQRQATVQAQATAQQNTNVDSQATAQANAHINAQATTNAQATAQAGANAQANAEVTATAAVIASKTPLYRLYNSSVLDHFYTTSAQERDAAIAHSGYTSEGITGYVFRTQVTNTTPLYRLVSSKVGDHFYTISAQNRDRAIAQSGYKSEGIACYVYITQVANSVPLYRLYSSKASDHFYTASAQERNTAIAQAGYTSEGIEGYILPA